MDNFMHDTEESLLGNPHEEDSAPAISTAEYFQNLKNRDQELYDQWKKTGSKKHLGELIGSLGGVIYSEVRRGAGSLPNSALSAEAKKWAIKAIKTYDPSKGATISTHVANMLPKTRRLNYKFQNAVRLPENMQLKYHDYNQTLTRLTEELNRDPNDEELAKALGWSKAHTVKFKNSLYSDLIESGENRPNEYAHFNENALLMEHFMSQLSEDEKYILTKSKIISTTEMAKHLGVNINRFNYLKGKLTEKLLTMKRESGMY